MEKLKLKWKDIIGTNTGRVMLVLFVFTVLLCGGFLSYTYQTQIESFRKIELAKLKGISNSLAVQIDGDQHEDIFRAFVDVDGIVSNDQNESFEKMHRTLQRNKEINGLPTDIYTLVYDKSEDSFVFGASSSSKPYFRHLWSEAHESHRSNYEEGALIGPYTDENGVWLSSFSPIRNSEGAVVGIVQADEPFDAFFVKARREVLQKLIGVIISLALLVFAMLHITQRILIRDDRLKKVLFTQRKEIELKNKEIVSSINRAKTIQDAILPDLEKMRKVFPDMFVMFQPRDIVSGDFFWYAEKGNYIYFAVADCTGHGVPGAFMSIMGHTLLNDALHQSAAATPAQILNRLNKNLKQILYDNGNGSSDGMDIALIRYEAKIKSLDFAGALRPLVRIRGGVISKFKGDKFSIGGYHERNKCYTDHEIDILPGDSFYMFSDGYTDQFGGKNGKKYMSRKFADTLLFANREHVMEDQQYLLQYEFHHWKAKEEQIDDVLVAGFKVPRAA